MTAWPTKRRRISTRKGARPPGSAENKPRPASRAGNGRPRRRREKGKKRKGAEPSAGSTKDGKSGQETGLKKNMSLVELRACRVQELDFAGRSQEREAALAELVAEVRSNVEGRPDYGSAVHDAVVIAIQREIGPGWRSGIEKFCQAWHNAASSKARAPGPFGWLRPDANGPRGSLRHSALWTS